MNKRVFITGYVLAVILTLFLQGCGKPYVGNIVNTNQPLFCNINSFPAECTVNEFEHFVIYAKITKLDDDGNYHIEGYFDPTQGSLKSWGHLQRRNSQFRIIFVSGDMIFDNKALPIRGTDMQHKLSFEFEYHTEQQIDSIAFTYKFRVRG